MVLVAMSSPTVDGKAPKEHLSPRNARESTRLLRQQYLQSNDAESRHALLLHG